MTKHEEMQAFVRHYKRINNKTVVTMAEIAAAAIAQGWPIPPAVSGEERLIKQFTDSQREEIRIDKKTRNPYRANLAITQRLKDGKQLPLWVDTDDASRSQVVMWAGKYRDQMVGEAAIGTSTVRHWSTTHPDEQEVLFPLDFADETEWRLNAPIEEKSGKAG